MNITDGIAICKACGKTFYKPLTGLEIGLAPSEQQVRGLIAFIGKLQEHMLKEHRSLFEQLFRERDQFFGMRMVMQFDLHDVNLEDQQDRLRWQIHQATLKHSLSDRNIAGVADEQADEIAEQFIEDHSRSFTIDECTSLHAELKALIRERMMKMLTETRNVLQEPGKYVVDSNPGNVVPLSTPN